tara:strand:+ start:342 stop:725 length:384 start_codon:yes stop_codon:yes gene_type:complete
MGGRSSRAYCEETSPPPYGDGSRPDPLSDIADTVLRKYVNCATYNTTNGHLNQNFQKELMFLIKYKTGLDANTSTLLLLCNLYFEQIKRCGRINNYYADIDFFFERAQIQTHNAEENADEQPLQQLN